VVLKDIFTKDNSLIDRTSGAADRPLPLADPLNRFSALVVDIIILFPVISLLISGIKRRQEISEWLSNEFATGKFLLSYIIVIFLTVLFYQTVSIALFGATPGKLFFNIRVVSIWDRTKPNWGSAFTRGVYWCLGAMLLLFPHLAIIYHRQRRPIYDRLADTIVLGQERYSVSPPDYRLSGVLKGILTGFYIFIIVSFISKVTSEPGDREVLPFGSTLFAKPQVDSCNVIETTLPKGHRAKKTNRLSQSLNLFAAGILEEDCLDKEADNELWNGKPSVQAYAAKALAFNAEPSVYEKYQKKVCSMPNATDYCLLLKAKKYDGISPPTKLNAQYQKLTNSLYPDIQLWALQHWMRVNNFTKALGLIEKLELTSSLGPFLGLQKLKALWQIEEKETARLALFTFLPNVGHQTGLITSAWFCYEESLRECGPAQKRICDWFNDHLKQFQNKDLPTMVALSVVRSTECAQEPLKNANDFFAAIDNNETRSLITRVTSKHKRESFYSWQSLFLQNSLQPQNKSEVGFRWLSTAKSPTDLSAIKIAWEREKWNLGDHGIAMAKELQKRLIQEDRYQEAKEVGSFISTSVGPLTRLPASSPPPRKMGKNKK